MVRPMKGITHTHTHTSSAVNDRPHRGKSCWKRARYDGFKSEWKKGGKNEDENRRNECQGSSVTFLPKIKSVHKCHFYVTTNSFYPCAHISVQLLI